MHLIITGIRGIPASHGGFETFAENLALYLVEQGWKVTVYCQVKHKDYPHLTESNWKGIHLIHIPIKGEGALSTIKFDWATVNHAKNQIGTILTLGYNTAIFNLAFRFNKKTNLINMDGIEWKRDKWRWYEKAWLFLNEIAGCHIGNHLIADHPEIQKHLETRVNASKITMIPYGARKVTSANIDLLKPFDLKPQKYAIVIARPEPENSILEIVKAFSNKSRPVKLVILGGYNPKNPYHNEVLQAANHDVIFVGAIYDHNILDALRFHAMLYIHGHTVGGTNPSLIEALGAAQPVLAHNNRFNRWVAGSQNEYFNDIDECEQKLDKIINSPDKRTEMSESSEERFNTLFTWANILEAYAEVIKANS
ncbi:DUF1972 domain-containing protein [Thiosulfativibrio zosterae]|uniref:Glycosyl transferase n=1 Tax=Thiosulfativibrio zosterae TaxID=2675053 RepID=A0A6F8PQL0_9GAMM|nr:DUF1972 domain-containing protein [Thiosulfativibrio zosterae]BBP44317.1 hypothetical protein THMIRHAT_20630 [Thiosulfativibrio zosterae]